MTAEQQTFIEPADILAIEVKCVSCGSRILYPLLKMNADQFKSRRHHCPNCPSGTGMFASAMEGPDVNRLAEFVEVLQRVIKNSTSPIRLQVRNFDVPTTRKSEVG